MTKKFTNIADDGVEKAIRRGFTVPDGAVNLAWAKAPPLTPENNIIIIDTSKAISENQNTSSKRKTVAFSNALGILEDINGNEIWTDEYPIVSDVFSLPETETDILDYTDESILPFLHVSRYFHVDFKGLANASLEAYLDSEIKVVNDKGIEHLDSNGEKFYKVFIVEANDVMLPPESRQTAYRVHVFLDMDPEADELYVTYNKVELNVAGGLKNQEINYKERVNPRSYFRYSPEETDIIDQSNSDAKVFSSKPSNMKQQVLNLPQPNLSGWKYYVPRKAIPDPRLFQLFRWRLACEITQPSINENTGSNLVTGSSTHIRVGVVVTGPEEVGGGWFTWQRKDLTNRANFLFYQLNNSDYNFSGIKFVNPLADEESLAAQKFAGYWHVNLDTVSLEDLNKFDILLWAPAANIDVSSYLPKINYFVENVGGTFIFETSSVTTISGIPNITTSTPLTASLTNPTITTYTVASTTRFYDATPSTEGLNSFGSWNEWPPNIGNIINNNNDLPSILADADVIAGWSLDQEDQDKLTGYKEIANTKFQYILTYGNDWNPVIEARETNAGESDYYQKLLIHKRFDSGGNIFFSTGCLFEDHMFEVGGTMASRSLQIPSISDLRSDYQILFRQMVSSQAMEGEMKLRLNAILYSTVNKPSPNTPESGVGSIVPTLQTTTVYSDWNSSWVINAANGILSDDEKTKYNFALLPKQADDTEPTWQRILSDRSVKQIIKEKIQQEDPYGAYQLYNSFEGATKRYFMIVTNPIVQVPSSSWLNDDSFPSAWSTAYSPTFTVPTHLGTYVVRDEMISGTGVGDGKRVYPPKPYELQANVSYLNSSTTAGSLVAIIRMTGSYSRYITAPPTSETTQVWVPATAGRYADVILHYNTDGPSSVVQAGYKHQGPLTRPFLLDTWTDSNYRVNGTNWPYPGLHGTLSVAGGDRGPSVLLVQRVMNQLIFFNQIPGPYLKEDGIYGFKTAAKVSDFQTARGAQYVPDYTIIDAQTWSLIGFALTWLKSITGWNNPDLNQAAAVATAWTKLRNISDGNPDSVYMRASWESNGPSKISEGFLIRFNEKLPIYKVSIMPALAGTLTNNLAVDWLDVTPDRTLVGYNYSQGSPGRILNKSAGDGQWIDIPVSEVTSNSVIFRATQTGKAGWGTARLIGLRDVAVYAKKYFPGVPGHYLDDTTIIPGATYEVTETFEFSTQVRFDAGVTKRFDPVSALQNVLGNSQTAEALSKIKWNVDSLEIIPEDQSTFFEAEFVNMPVDTSHSVEENYGSNYLLLTYKGYDNAISSETFVLGPRIGNGSFTYWTKSQSGRVDPYSRSYGWIQKDDGLKLICKANGLPYGFPVSLPSQVTTSMHFARYKLNAYNVDQTIHFGFYDAIQDEFITNRYGEPEISYYDYIRRGPQNIYIAVQTTYELDVTSNLPGSSDPIFRPFKWAMPVYGITSGLNSKIQIQPLSPGLGVADLWALPVKTGSFARAIQLRPRSEGALTTYLKDYQGTTVKAYYDVPEAKNGPWSSLYGRPYVDIKGEIPIIIDDNTIQIRQSPILMALTPTLVPTPADPWLPVFKVYRRQTLTSSWEEVSMSEIADYDAWNGTITLATLLTNNDPRLVKVDYTSNRNVYFFKSDGTNKINLNPYINGNPDWVNKALYIYLIPEYIADTDNVLISNSLQTRTLRLTTNPAIFSPNQVEYDPSALMLGAVYITSASNIEDLSILDTRKRGGGASTAYLDKIIFDLEPEAESYWDIVPSTSTSYQHGGFAIIRLPAAIRDHFTLSQIKTIIDNNITLGVMYELEDMDGNRWSE